MFLKTWNLNLHITFCLNNSIMFTTLSFSEKKYNYILSKAFNFAMTVFDDKLINRFMVFILKYHNFDMLPPKYHKNKMVINMFNFAIISLLFLTVHVVRYSLNITFTSTLLETEFTWVISANPDTISSIGLPAKRQYCKFVTITFNNNRNTVEHPSLSYQLK